MISNHYPLKLYLKEKPVAVMLALALFLNILSFVWLAVRIRPHLGQIFLHYNILFGVDLVGTWYQVFILPAVGFFIIGINATIGWLLFHRDKFSAHLLNAASVCFQALLLAASGLLVFLNV